MKINNKNLPATPNEDGPDQCPSSFFFITIPPPTSPAQTY